MGGGGGSSWKYIREKWLVKLILKSSPFYYWVYNIFIDETYVQQFYTSYQI